MSIFSGSTEIAGGKIFVGSTPVQKVYSGATLVWEAAFLANYVEGGAASARGYNVVAGRGSLTPDAYKGYQIIIMEGSLTYFKGTPIWGSKISILGPTTAPPVDIWNTIVHTRTEGGVGTVTTMNRTSDVSASVINSGNSKVRDWGFSGNSYGSAALRFYDALRYDGTVRIT